jgi:glutamate-1-semialdehyde 2,1-aminomutase
MKTCTFDKSLELFKRAAQVIPCGIGGHLSPAITVPGSFPYYAVSGQGCRYTDVDGNQFIDFMCGFGPVVLGFNHPRVDAAAAERRAMGSVFNHPTPLAVELAEKLVSLVDGADWATFARNGSDVTTYSVQIAREYTHRKKILAAAGAYHGTHAWCIHGLNGLIPEDYQHVHRFPWNDVEALEGLCRKFEGQVAGIIVTPFHHPAFGDSVMPAPGWYEALHRLRDRYDLVLISDDVRCGWRIDLAGSHHHWGFKPDLTCFCKAIANGHVISALTGSDRVKAAAARIYFTGSYFQGASEMAAALACIDELEKTNAIQKMHRTGTLLMDGLKKLAEDHGLQVSLTGHPAIPTMTFSNEHDFRRMQRFSAESARRGVYFHPHHNWFLMAAHEEADINEALEVADVAFGMVKKEFGS